MRITSLVVVLCAQLSLVACGDDNNNGGGDDTPTDGSDGAPAFTDGVSTLTGAAEAGDIDGPRGTARLSNPVNVAVGPDGAVFVADFDNGKIKRVDATSGDTTTVIAQQGFKKPFAMVFDASGALFVTTDDAPDGSHGAMSGSVWRVDVNARTATPIATSIGRPRGIAVLSDGRIAVSDYQHHVIELVNPTTGAVTVLAGTWDQAGMVNGAGAAARFSTPYGMVARSDGTLLVADYDNNRLRTVTVTGQVSTLGGAGNAGFGDGSADSAKLDHPEALAITQSGDVFIADTGNFRVRRLKGGQIDTVAGDGTGGYRDDDNNLDAQLYGLEGIAVTPDGKTVFVADGGRGEAVPFNRIRSIKL